MTGQVSTLKLIQIGDKDIADINKTTVKISEGKMLWSDVDTDLDLAITPENGRVNFDWVVKSEDAPHAVTFQLEDGGIPIAYKGVDAEGEAVEVTAVSDGDKVTETIEKGGNYPKIINPTLNLQVSINYIADDIHVWRTGTTWTAGLYDTDLYIGRLTSTNNRHGMGLRFRNVTIPSSGVTIDTAYLDLCAGFDYSTVPFYARIVGDLESSAATFSTIANYQTRRGTSCGGSNDNKRTTAEVDWDSSETWTEDEWYETPEIKTVVQEIVDQTGWSSGNAMALFCDDHDYRDTSSGRKRSCYAADAADPVKLHIEYTDHTSHYSLNALVDWNGHEDDVEWWYSQDGSKDFSNMISEAAAAWNATPTVIYMIPVSNIDDSVLRLYSDDYGDTTWIGMHIPHVGYGNIKLNEYFTETDLQWAEVASHEMGHAHGLYDVDYECELMRGSGFIGTPDPFIGDIAGINAKY